MFLNLIHKCWVPFPLEFITFTKKNKNTINNNNKDIFEQENQGNQSILRDTTDYQSIFTQLYVNII